MTYKKHLCGHCAGVVVIAVATTKISAMAASDPFGIEGPYETKDQKTLHGSLKTMTTSHQKTTTMTTGFSFHFGTLDNIDDLEHEGDTVWRMDVKTGSEEHGVAMRVNHPENDE